MGIPKEPRPVKYFVALLSNQEDLLLSIEQELTPFLGSVEFASEILSWAVTDYYEKEIGAGLRRRFVSFVPLASPELLPEFKLRAHEIEASQSWELGEQRGRRINIDPGYIDAGKVVLASTKNASHRLYLRGGIYGETTLVYESGAYRGCAYTYPDYLWPQTLSFFSAVRSIYLKQLREMDKKGARACKWRSRLTVL